MTFKNNFNIPEETLLTGIKAYEFLENMMTVDKKQNLKQKLIIDAIERGEGDKIKGSTYYKTRISISCGNFNQKYIRFDLGDLEFGENSIVSDGLKHYFLPPIKSAIENPDFYVEHNLYGKNLTEKDIIECATTRKRELNRFIANLRQQETLLKHKENSQEVKKSQENEKPQTRKRTKNKNNENER